MPCVLCSKSALFASKHEINKRECHVEGLWLHTHRQLSEQGKAAFRARRRQVCGPAWAAPGGLLASSGGLCQLPTMSCRKCSPHVLRDH